MTHNPHSQGTMSSYLLGFSLSVVLTLAAFGLVVAHVFSKEVVLGAILGLGFIQTAVQLFLFLHLGSEPKPRLNLVVFLFMLLVLVIVVLGSIWIMYELNYNLM